MKNRTFLYSLLTLLIMAAATFTANAQVFPPPPPASVPLDGGAAALLAIGALYAAKKLDSKRKK